MNVPRFRLLARRAVVLAAVAGAIVVALVAVEASARWRADSAAFEPAPATAASVVDAAAIEAERTAELHEQLDAAGEQLSELQAALSTAAASVDSDAGSASATRDQLAAAQLRLKTLQTQLRHATARLGALNRAAERQAALNRSAAAGSGSGGAAQVTSETREVEDDD